MLLILVIIILLLLNITEHYNNTEKTPYSHISTYDFDYLNKCRSGCSNSRCVYKSMDECINKCKTGCRSCPYDNSFMCETL